MAVARAHYIPSLLQAHLDDLAFIAGQRRAALGSRRHGLREFGELSERLEAHLQGALVAPTEALAAQLQPQLSAEDRDEAFAAAYVLLRLADAKTTHVVVVEFSRARADTLAGLRDALSMAPPALFAEEMRSALDQAKPITAVAAAVVLANHWLLESKSPRLSRLLENDDASVCELAWRAAQLADAASSSRAPMRPFQLGLAHESFAVRSAAWSAVAWAGQFTAMALLRHGAAAGDAVALHWLAILGGHDDASLLYKTAMELEDVRARCELLARFGHPRALNALVRWMAADDDVALAVAARKAFTRMTGMDIRGERRTLPAPDGADDFTREMAPDVWVPDVGRARALLSRHMPEWDEGTRWCQGVRLDGEVSRAAFAAFDFECRWEVAARANFGGRRVSAPPPIY